MPDKKTTPVVILFILTIGITGLFSAPWIHAETMPTGIVLADDHGKIVYSQNKDTPFIPASILKILTSLAALQILGEDYRFSTVYFFDENSKNLYIKGFGDPLLISEVIDNLCRDIRLKINSNHIHHIILDPTYFSGQIRVPGQGNSLNPYDAPVGALCANFNTLMFKWSPEADGFVSAEPQTPLLSIFSDDIKETGLNQGRIILSEQQSLLYPGLLIKYFLEKNHVKVTGSVLQEPVEVNFELNQGKRHTFVSPFELKEVVQKLLKYSSNFMANQLLLTIGAKTYGAPATLEKGVKAVRLFSEHHLNLNHFSLSEGSGLSRKNGVSPEQMLKILIEFMPYYSLLNSKANDFFKTGTLSDVRTRAGYIQGNDARLYPYVIMVNHKNKGYEAIRKKLLHMVLQMTR